MLQLVWYWEVWIFRSRLKHGVLWLLAFWGAAMSSNPWKELEGVTSFGLSVSRVMAANLHTASRTVLHTLAHTCTHPPYGACCVPGLGRQMASLARTTTVALSN